MANLRIRRSTREEASIRACLRSGIPSPCCLQRYKASRTPVNLRRVVRYTNENDDLQVRDYRFSPYNQPSNVSTALPVSQLLICNDIQHCSHQASRWWCPDGSNVSDITEFTFHAQLLTKFGNSESDIKLRLLLESTVKPGLGCMEIDGISDWMMTASATDNIEDAVCGQVHRSLITIVKHQRIQPCDSGTIKCVIESPISILMFDCYSINNIFNLPKHSEANVVEPSTCPTACGRNAGNGISAPLTRICTKEERR